MNRTLALQQTTQELRDQIRTKVRDQIRTAQGPDGRQQVQITTPEGKTVTISNGGGPAARGAPEGLGQTIGIPAGVTIRDLDVPPRAAAVSIAFFVVMACIIIGFPIARAVARMLDRKSQQPQIPHHVTAQLTQLTQAVDAIAIEVERISEGQRFTTKLLSEKQKSPKTLPSP